MDAYLSNTSLCVKQLSTAPTINRIQTYNYLWHVASIALFYSIPVVQLVITYQRVSFVPEKRAYFIICSYFMM